MGLNLAQPVSQINTKQGIPYSQLPCTYSLHLGTSNDFSWLVSFYEEVLPRTMYKMRITWACTLAVCAVRLLDTSTNPGFYSESLSNAQVSCFQNQ